MQRASFAEQATCTASDRRASSPPEATLASGRSGWPGLAVTRNSTASKPCAAGSPFGLGDVDEEAAAGHAQRLHARGDVLGQRARRGLPRGGKLRGQLAIGLERFGLGSS